MSISRVWNHKYLIITLRSVRNKQPTHEILEYIRQGYEPVHVIICYVGPQGPKIATIYQLVSSEHGAAQILYTINSKA
jgi:hypothetical protein